MIKDRDRLISEAFSKEPGASRFWSKVHKGDGPDACWIWTAATAGMGYGVICVGSKPAGTHCMVYAHRVSLILAREGMPLGEQLSLHNCPGGDNPACVNPAHLWAGTHAQNNQDAVNKGRVHPWHLHPELIRRGERHHAAVLTADQVRELRRRYAAGGVSQSQLCREFGLRSQGSLSSILRGAKWRHIS